MTLLSLARLSDTELFALGLESLCSIFSASSGALRNIVRHFDVFNWRNCSERRGAYSYSTPESKLARIILMAPLNNTLYFAGEALYEGAHPATVEEALVSGKKAASAISDSTAHSLYQ